MKHKKIISLLLSSILILSFSLPAFAKVASDPNNCIKNGILNGKDMTSINDEIQSLNDEMNNCKEELARIQSQTSAQKEFIKMYGTDMQYKDYCSFLEFCDRASASSYEINEYSSRILCEKLYEGNSIFIDVAYSKWCTDNNKMYDSRMPLVIHFVLDKQGMAFIPYSLYQYVKIIDSNSTQCENTKSMLFELIDTYDTLSDKSDIQTLFMNKINELNDGITEADIENISAPEIYNYYKYGELYIAMENLTSLINSEEYNSFTSWIEIELHNIIQESYKTDIEQLNAQMDDINNKISDKYIERSSLLPSDEKIDEWIQEKYGDFLYRIPNLLTCTTDCHGTVNGYNDNIKEAIFDWRYEASTKTLYLNNADSSRIFDENIYRNEKYHFNISKNVKTKLISADEVLTRTLKYFNVGWSDCYVIYADNVVITGNNDLSNISLQSEDNLIVSGGGVLKIKDICANNNLKFDNVTITTTKTIYNDGIYWTSDFSQKYDGEPAGQYALANNGIVANNEMQIVNSTINNNNALFASRLNSDNSTININIKETLNDKRNIFDVRENACFTNGVAFATYFLDVKNTDINIVSPSSTAMFISNIVASDSNIKIKYDDVLEYYYNYLSDNRINSSKYQSVDFYKAKDIALSNVENGNAIWLSDVQTKTTTYGFDTYKPLIVDDENAELFKNCTLSIEGYPNGLINESKRKIIFEDCDIDINAKNIGISSSDAYSSLKFVNSDLIINARTGIRSCSDNRRVITTIDNESYNLLDDYMQNYIDKLFIDIDKNLSYAEKFIEYFIKTSVDSETLTQSEAESFKNDLYNGKDVSVNDTIFKYDSDNHILKIYNATSNSSGIIFDNSNADIVGTSEGVTMIYNPNNFTSFSVLFSGRPDETIECGFLTYNNEVVISGDNNKEELEVVGYRDYEASAIFQSATSRESENKTLIIRKGHKIKYDTGFEDIKINDYQAYNTYLVTSDNIINIEKDGYKFTGWYYDNDFQRPVAVGDCITEDVTFYARWIYVAGAETSPDTPVSPVKGPEPSPVPISETTPIKIFKNDITPQDSALINEEKVVDTSDNTVVNLWIASSIISIAGYFVIKKKNNIISK